MEAIFHMGTDVQGDLVRPKAYGEGTVNGYVVGCNSTIRVSGVLASNPQC